MYPYPPQPRRRTRHGLHALLTIATGGLWAPVWIARTLINRNV